MTAPTDPSYTAQALRTESPITPALQTRLRETPRLVHAVLGLLTEAGELADPVKKHIYYGRPLDLVNLREEIGDCLWYLAIAADALGTTLEAEQARNLAKLRTRYPHVFTAEAAQVRDLDRERQVLEGAEVKALQGAMAADDKRLRDAEERVWPGETRGCDAPDLMADEILSLRKQLAAAKQERVDTYDDYEGQIAAAEALIDPEANGETTIAGMADQILTLRKQLDAARADNVEIRRRLNEETDRHRATNAEKIELFKQKEWANQHAAELVKERDAAHMTILAQKRGNQFLRLLIDKVRGIVNRDDAMSERLEEIALAIHEFDHGTLEPAPETEPAPCPECERWQRAKRIDSELVASKAKEIERLQAFVGKVRSVMDREYDGVEFDDLSRALAEFDANSSATFTSSVVKESLTPAAEGGQ